MSDLKERTLAAIKRAKNGRALSHGAIAKALKIPTSDIEYFRLQTALGTLVRRGELVELSQAGVASRARKVFILSDQYRVA